MNRVWVVVGKNADYGGMVLRVFDNPAAASLFVLSIEHGTCYKFEDTIFYATFITEFGVESNV